MWLQISQYCQYSHQHNVVARSSNLYCRGKAISVTYSGCVSVALSIQNAARVRRIAICCLPRADICCAHYLRRHEFW